MSGESCCVCKTPVDGRFRCALCGRFVCAGHAVRRIGGWSDGRPGSVLSCTSCYEKYRKGEYFGWFGAPTASVTHIRP